jgi:hypothetical protein
MEKNILRGAAIQLSDHPNIVQRSFLAWHAAHNQNCRDES